MRPLRFPSRLRWWMVAGLAMLFGLPALPLAAWFAREMPPLQRYYLLAYVHSTERAKQPGATTQVQRQFTYTQAVSAEKRNASLMQVELLLA